MTNLWFCCKILPQLSEDNVELHCWDTEAIWFSFIPIHGLCNELKRFGKDIDLSEIDPTRELYSEGNKQFKKLESSPDVDIDEAVFFSCKILYYLKDHQNQLKQNAIESSSVISTTQ